MFKSSARLLLKLTLPAVLSVSITPGVLFAQDAKPAVQESECVYHVFLLGANGKLVPLEQQKANYKSEMHQNIIKGLSESREDTVPEAKSTMRAAPEAHFIMKVPEGFDPSALIYLKPFVVKKLPRMLPVAVARANYTGQVKTTATADTSMALTFKKYGQRSIEITPTAPLAPGEYAFGITGNRALGVGYFGVDGK